MSSPLLLSHLFYCYIINTLKFDLSIFYDMRSKSPQFALSLHSRVYSLYRYPRPPSLGYDRSLQSLTPPKYFAKLSKLILTQHRVHIEFLTHIVKLLPKLRIWFYLILIPLRKFTQICLKIRITRLNLYRSMHTSETFFYISALAAIFFFFSFSSSSLAALLPAYIICKYL